LDGTGARVSELPTSVEAGRLAFEIGPRCKTLWYEIVLE